MLKNKKVLAALLIPIVGFMGYTMTKPKPVVKTKIKGTIYVMPQPFLLNLSDGRYVKLSVALLLAPGQSDGAEAGEGASSSGTEGGPGTLPEEPLVREIVTNSVTNQSGEDLVGTGSRKAIKQKILAAITKETDVKVSAVLMPELTVQ
ncbi:MAG TPA: flagellar basal body-associated FliL family protein [Solirubrobacteraceae bacterium]|jgi:flagellar FliL protein|nr:flagellar basal body-associated FliL family protein [Solirubrobacteraceae bacterium]